MRTALLWVARIPYYLLLSSLLSREGKEGTFLDFFLFEVEIHRVIIVCLLIWIYRNLLHQLLFCIYHLKLRLRIFFLYHDVVILYLTFCPAMV